MTMRQEKQNQYGKVEYIDYIRNADPVLCLLSVLAFYFSTGGVETAAL